MPNTTTASAEAMADRYYRRVYNFCRSLLRNDADVQDACQEVFLIISRKRRELDAVRNPAPWVMKIALLTCLHLRRKRGRTLQMDEKIELDAPVDPGPPIDAAEDVAKIRNAMVRVPDRYRAVLTLHYQQGMPHDQMAVVVGVSRGALRVLLHRAVARLRQEVRKK